VEPPPAHNLGSQRLLEQPNIGLCKWFVRAKPGGVKDPSKRRIERSEDCGHCPRIRNVDRGNLHLRTAGPQCTNSPVCTGRLQPTTPRQYQMSRTTVEEPTRQLKANPTEATGHQIMAIG